MSLGSTTGKRTESKRVQRVATRGLSLSGDIESIDPCTLQAQKDIEACFLDPAPCALDSLSITGHLALFRKQEDFKPEEQENLRQLRQASLDLEVTYQLVEEFLHMVRERTGERLDSWLNKVDASQLQAFHTFVTGVQKDNVAALAGFTLPWSNGPLEGNINRLKLIKRSMYGRAEFDLLKLRVLYQSKKIQERKNKYKNSQAQVDRLKKQGRTKNGTNSQHSITGISKGA